MKKRINSAVRLGGMISGPSDAIALAGLSLVVAGVAHWSESAALILAGLMLFTYGYVTAKPGKK